MLVVGIMNETVDLENLSVEKLKKIKESLEKNREQKTSFEPKLNVIDKFTSIDELLIQTIQDLQNLTLEQRETNRQMQINNKLLLALFYKESADGSVIRQDPIAIDTSILEEISQGGAYITRVVNLENKTIGTKEIVFQGEFEGSLAEVLFVSDASDANNKEFSARVIADDNTIYQDSYTEFESRGATETDMACFEDELNDWYLLQFQNVNFNQKILIEVYDSSATFLRIYIKYHRSV